jgi:hypothetical protein
MFCRFLGLGMILCFSSTIVEAAPRGRGGAPAGGRGPSEARSPGGNFSEGRAPGNTPQGFNNEAGQFNRSPQATGAQGAAAYGYSNQNAPRADGAQGAAAGAAYSNRNEPNATGAQGFAAGTAYSNRNNPTLNGAQGAAIGYGVGNNANPVAWGAAANHLGYTNAAIPYVYGTAANGAVIVNNQYVDSTEQYSQQAADLAQTVTANPANLVEQWYNLGAFGMVRNEQQHSQLVVQLAVNQQGAIRGTYTDQVTDNTLPIHGNVDPKTQRAAWSIGDNSSIVMETGIANLTQDQAPALLYKNGKTEQWNLIRIKNNPAR